MASPCCSSHPVIPSALALTAVMSGSFKAGDQPSERGHGKEALGRQLFDPAELWVVKIGFLTVHTRSTGCVGVCHEKKQCAIRQSILGWF